MSPGNERLDDRGLVGDRLPQFRQIALRQRKGDVDRSDLDDGRERDRVGLARVVADLDVRHADAAGDRRADEREVALDPQQLELRGVGFDGGGEDVDLGLGVVERDHGGRVLGHQRFVALDVARGLLELRLRAVEDALGLANLRIDRAMVEREQHVALADHGAVAEVDFDDLAVDAGLHRHLGDRRHVAEQIDANGNLLLDRLRDLDRDSAPCLCPSGTARPHPAGSKAAHGGIAAREGERRGHPDQQDPSLHSNVGPALRPASRLPLSNSPPHSRFFVAYFVGLLSYNP